ncbi:hypothetical protein MON38_19475 [Hymenobacter sp. DH14]|uniref:Uncharacterized protein n=1 Tax=Hymenobacter cyanobacteriorum TaxID=2926463 RepID=A0A9X2AJB7_9BACT|nr:hypothetical protein [Hymenobacter cyanobacteriorum]MCI1189610.1 hypothetical protein [Hymenobacter cyanobacteriorum]
MIFRANSLQPVAGATGVVSRVQLPAAGRVSSSLFEAMPRRTLPTAGATGGHSTPRGHLGRQQAQHRAQCRANCMSKANF